MCPIAGQWPAFLFLMISIITDHEEPLNMKKNISKLKKKQTVNPNHDI